MLNFDPTVTVRSESLADVSFTVRRLSVIERSRVDLQILEQQMRAAELQEEVLAIQAEYPLPSNGDKRDIPPEVRTRELKLDFELGCLISGYLKPAYIRAGLVSIEGLQHGGRPATAETLLASGPDLLINEVWLALNQHARLTGEQEKNSSSPSTSPAADRADGKSSTAGTANGGDSTGAATA